MMNKKIVENKQIEGKTSWTFGRIRLNITKTTPKKAHAKQ